MAERKRDSHSWLVEAEDAASGGRIASAQTAEQPDFEGDEEADSTNVSGAGASESVAPRERTDVIPRAVGREDAARWRDAVGRRGRPASRRVRRTLRHVDPVSILKLSLFYYACFVVLWLALVTVAFTVLSAAGLVERIEKLGQAFVLWQNVDISLWLVERWAFLLGLTCAVLASLVNVFLAFLYNLAADVVGGAEMTFVDKEL